MWKLIPIIEQIDALMTGESAPPIQVQATVEEPDTPVEAQEATAPEEPVTESSGGTSHSGSSALNRNCPLPTEEPAVESSGMSGKEWVANVAGAAQICSHGFWRKAISRIL